MSGVYDCQRGSDCTQIDAGTFYELSMCRVYLPTSYASLSFSECPAGASNESSIATITHTLFSKSAEPRSAETDWTTRILNGK